MHDCCYIPLKVCIQQIAHILLLVKYVLPCFANNCQGVRLPGTVHAGNCLNPRARLIYLLNAGTAELACSQHTQPLAGCVVTGFRRRCPLTCCSSTGKGQPLSDVADISVLTKPVGSQWLLCCSGFHIVKCCPPALPCLIKRQSAGAPHA